MTLKNFLDFDGVLILVDELKTAFANITHTHTKSEITDLIEPVQSDWTESDETKLGYIKNKPDIESVNNNINLVQTDLDTYKTSNDAAVQANADAIASLQGFVDDLGGSTSEATVILEEQTFDGFSNGDLEQNFFILIVENKNYTVIWDGIEYNLDSILFEGEIASPVLGNLSLLDDTLTDTGEPFVIFSIDAETSGETDITMISSSDATATSHTIAIYQNAENTTVTTPDWNVNDETDSAFIKNRPFYEGDAVWVDTFPETPLTYTYSTDESMWVFDSSITSDMLNTWESDWESVKVIWNGVEYICSPQYFNGIKCIGDMNLFMTGVATEGAEPFIIAIANMGGAMIISYALDEAEPEDTTVTNTITRTIAISLSTQEIHTIDPKFIESIEWDKVSGKPFGVISAGAVVADTTITFTAGEVAPLTMNTDNIISGAIYTVTINGTSYKGVGNVNDGYSGIAIYNNSGDDEAIVVDMYGGLVVWSDTPEIFTANGDYTIKIALYEDAVQQIDAKYLPDINTYELSSITIGQEHVRTWDYDIVAEYFEKGLVRFTFEAYESSVGTTYHSVILSGSKDIANSIIKAGQVFTRNDVDYYFSVVVTTADMTFLIEEYTGSGSSLPRVTTDDNGKILQVEEGVWVIKEMPSSLPTVSTSDNGKFLQVVDGVWTAVTISNAEEGVY